MAKDPAFLFYAKDFYEGTRTMLPEERACYVDLLIYQHQNGAIPFDTKRVLMYCSGVDEATLQATLQAKFKRTDNGWVNEKLISVMDDRQDYKSKLSDSGIVGQFFKKAKNAMKSSKLNGFKTFVLEEFGRDTLIEMLKENNSNYEATLQATLQGYDKHLANANAIEDKDVNKEKVSEQKIPSLIEFIDYAKNQCAIAKFNFRAMEGEIRLKYNSWVENGWKDGHGKKIVNWKSKLNNTLPHIAERYKDEKQEPRDLAPKRKIDYSSLG